MNRVPARKHGAETDAIPPNTTQGHDESRAYAQTWGYTKIGKPLSGGWGALGLKVGGGGGETRRGEERRGGGETR
jgi:hypothetical protein